jgi:hypothetical protein
MMRAPDRSIEAGCFLCGRFGNALKHAVWHLSTMAYSNEQEYRFLEAHPIDQPVPGVKIRYRPYSVIR